MYKRLILVDDQAKDRNFQSQIGVAVGSDTRSGHDSGRDGSGNGGRRGGIGSGAAISTSEGGGGEALPPVGYFFPPPGRRAGGGLPCRLPQVGRPNRRQACRGSVMGGDACGEA